MDRGSDRQSRPKTTHDSRNNFASRVLQWRRASGKWLERAAGALIGIALAALFLSEILERLAAWEWLMPPLSLMRTLDLLGWLFWLGLGLWFLAATPPEAKADQPTIERLQQLTNKFNELN